MRLLLPNIIQHAFANRPKRIPCIDNVQHDVAGVDDLVQLAVYPAGGALCVDRLDDIGVGLLEVGRS